MDIFMGLILAIAVSIDGLSVGIIYGMKGIKIPLFSQLIIVVATSAAFVTAMNFGNVIMSFFHPTTAKIIGVSLLSVIGIWSLLEAFSRESNEKDKKTIAIFRITTLGLVVKILREPIAADTDTSGVIDIKEALLLGIALALDAFAAGFGASAAGFQIIWTTILISVTSLLFLSVGLCIGCKKLFFSKKIIIKCLPGTLLLALAIFKAIQK
ncbi:MAG: sporulation membrane protein YtaF [Tepidanaerobacteraceae bacterium]|nr:sporulation membrane protein YtaF [Tepidanaerobacteraceae bacterium]